MPESTPSPESTTAAESAAPKKSQPGDDLTTVAKWLIVASFCVPLAIAFSRIPSLPTSEFMYEYATLYDLPDRVQQKLNHILFIPLSAMLVVFARLTLGLRVLGPFRSILLAVAFELTGVWMGVLYLAISVFVILAVRAGSRELSLPYFGRITVALSSVSLLMVVAVMVGFSFRLDFLQNIVYFPIVVLCLVADAFVDALAQERLRSALWRGGMTVALAMVLALATEINELEDAMHLYPELLIAQIGSIIVIAKFMKWGLLEHLNPKVGIDEEDKKESSG